MNLEDEDIDRLFRERFEGGSTEPPPGVWETLDKGLASSGKYGLIAQKKLIWLKWLSVGVTVPIISTVVYYQLEPDEPDKSATIHPKETTPKPEIKPKTSPTIEKTSTLIDTITYEEAANMLKEKPETVPASSVAKTEVAAVVSTPAKSNSTAIKKQPKKQPRSTPKAAPITTSPKTEVAATTISPKKETQPKKESVAESTTSKTTVDFPKKETKEGVAKVTAPKTVVESTTVKENQETTSTIIPKEEVVINTGEPKEESITTISQPITETKSEEVTTNETTGTTVVTETITGDNVAENKEEVQPTSSNENETKEGEVTDETLASTTEETTDETRASSTNEEVGETKSATESAGSKKEKKGKKEKPKKEKKDRSKPAKTNGGASVATAATTTPPPENAASKFNFSLYAAPELNFRTLVDNDDFEEDFYEEDDEAVFIAEDYGLEESVRSTMTLGFNVGYDIGTRWNIQTGIQYASYSQVLSTDFTYEVEDENPDSIDVWSSIGLVEMPYSYLQIPGSAQEDDEFDFNMELAQKLTYIRFPLVVQYTIKNDKIRWYAEAGIGVNWLKREFAEVTLNSSIDPAFTDTFEGIEFLKTTYMDYTIAAGLEYQLNDNFYLFAAPRFKGAIRSLNFDGPVDVKPYSLGLKTGITLRF
jgi:opacity protein-like surface antigen